MKPTVLFLGLDGATFSVLDPLMERGVMPFLRSFVEQGARAQLRSIVPPLTPPAWTSLMTGKRPGTHGVFDFFQRETPDGAYYHFSSSLDIHSATIWSLASDNGQRVTSLNFPLMFPPPDVSGSIVPGGWMPWRQLRLGCRPAGLFDRLKSLPSFNAREMALDMTLEAKAIEGCAEEEFGDWIKLHTRREQRWSDILRYLMVEEPAELVGIVFDGVDKLQHLCWRFLDPACAPEAPTAWEAEMTALCEEYFSQLDTILAEAVELAGPDALVVLASDHGFGPTSDVFYLNSWLEKQGYLAWIGAGDSAPLDDEVGPQVGFNQMTRHIAQLDWERTVAYAATPSSQGISIVARRPDGTATMSDETYRRVRGEIERSLRQVLHPETGRPLVTEIYRREEAHSGPFEALGPDLTITLADGAAISILRSDEVFQQRNAPRGNHRPEGVFLAAGPGIRAGARVDPLSIVDVAPLLLYHLDLPLPVDLAGRLAEEVLIEGAVESRPPRSMAGSTPETPAEFEARPEMYDAEAEATILKRLRALGYVE